MLPQNPRKDAVVKAVVKAAGEIQGPLANSGIRDIFVVEPDLESIPEIKVHDLLVFHSILHFWCCITCDAFFNSLCFESWYVNRIARVRTTRRFYAKGRGMSLHPLVCPLSTLRLVAPESPRRKRSVPWEGPVFRLTRQDSSLWALKPTLKRRQRRGSSWRW